MPTWISVVILGIIEGITEFLPVSSTGHLLIAQNWLGRQSFLFTVVIQCGAVLAVIPLFPDRIRQFFSAATNPDARSYLLKILVAFFITGVGGFIMDKKGFKLEDRLMPIAVALLAGGVLFLLVEAWIKGKPKTEVVGWDVAIGVGLAQLVAAAFPGTSRSGATILLALVFGLSRPAATEFTFLVGIPTMLAAGGWSILKTLRHREGPIENWSMVLLGTVVSAIVSFIAVNWLLRYIRTHSFKAMGWYRVGIGLLLLILLATGRIVDSPKAVRSKPPQVAVAER